MRKDRSWGFWTEQKLAMLADYLPAFTTASKKAPTKLYLDLFAGDSRNFSRTTGEEIDGSPRVALLTSPPFTKVILFELPSLAVRLETELKAEFPGRDLKVVAGDCNDTIHRTLAYLAPLRWSPTFALVDQYAAEIRWPTLEALARFREGRRKTELWLLFAPSMLPRGLASETPEAAEKFRHRVDAMFGTHEWRPMYDQCKAGEITPADLRADLVNLMRWRLETELAYAVTHTFEMRNTHGVPLYEMIFATDDKTGNKIMRSIYEKAALVQPKMKAQALAKKQALKDEKTGMLGLFEPLVPVLRGSLYEHEPPWDPYAPDGDDR